MSRDRLLVSIHDVMPETLAPVRELLAMLADSGAEQVTLLVVPGLDWQNTDLKQLESWVEHGHELAGHGWVHRIPYWGGLWHRFHGAVMSRDVAEHLAHDSAGVATLMQRCRDWFRTVDLPVPEFYVPPAWALGSISDETISEMGFSHVETLSGIRDVRKGRHRLLPLYGYEADTGFREMAVASFNRVNALWASASARPARLALHPHDASLRLARQLRERLARPFEVVTITALEREVS